MNDNQIDNWSDLDELKNAKSLETVYLERNPLQKDPQYRRKIMLALPSIRQIDATFIRFWGASVQFTCWFQCSLLPPCLPYLQKKKKKHTSFWTHTCLTELCSHSVRKHVFQLWTHPHLIWHTRVHSLTHAMVLIIRLDINGRKIAPTHPQRFLELSFAICFLDCFACGWQEQGAMALAPLPLLPLHCDHMRRESIQCEGRPKCHESGTPSRLCTSIGGDCLQYDP